MLKVIDTTSPQASPKLHEVRPFVARPVCAAGRGGLSATTRFSTHYTAVASALYLKREPGSDRFGSLPTAYLDKRPDLVASGRSYPVARVEAGMKSGLKIWQNADAAVTPLDKTAPAAYHIVCSLPTGESEANWVRLVEDYIEAQFVRRGMIVDYAIHALHDADGGWSTWPHCHMLVTIRRWRNDRRQGQRQSGWLDNNDRVRNAELAWYEASGLYPVQRAL